MSQEFTITIDHGLVIKAGELALKLGFDEADRLRQWLNDNKNLLRESYYPIPRERKANP